MPSGLTQHLGPKPRRQIDVEAALLEHRGDPGFQGDRAQIEGARYAAGSDQAQGHALPVQQRVARLGFDGVANRVTQIEHHAKTGLLSRILFDDRGFDPQVAEDELRSDRRIEAENLVDMILLPGEEFLVADQGMFDRLRDPGFYIARSQCRKAV